MKVIISRISFILLGFSLFSNVLAKQPRWVNNPDEFCPDSELCAVGEASGRMGAETEARKSLSSIFQTKIKASTQSYNRVKLENNT